MQIFLTLVRHQSLISESLRTIFESRESHPSSSFRLLYYQSEVMAGAGNIILKKIENFSQKKIM